MRTLGDTQDDLGELSEAQLCDYIAQQEAIESCAQAHKAVAHALIAKRGCHSRDGSKDLKSWIQETGRHSRHHANRQADIAAAITDLPEIWACLAGGILSQDQVAVLVRFATADTDAYWAEEAPKMSVRQLQVCAAQLRKVEELEQQEAAAEAEAAATTPGEADTEEAPVEAAPEPEPEVEDKLTITPLPGGGIRLCGTFGTVMAEFIEAVLRRQADRYPRDPETGDYEPLPVRMAWALFDLLTTTERSDWSDRAVVTVHADLATVALPAQI